MPRDHEGRPVAPVVRLPGRDDEVTRTVLESLEAMHDALPEVRVTVDGRFARPEVPAHGAAFALSIPLIETCLDRDPSDVSAPLLAELAVMSLFPAVPEQMALQVAFGRGIAEEHARDIARLIARASRRGLTVDDYVAELVATGRVPDTRATRCFCGEAPHEPDRSRVARGVTLFRRAAGHAPEELRPSLLCVASWLLWSIGKRPSALAHLGEAARIDPEHVLVHGLSLHLGARSPSWLGVRPRT